MTAASIPTPPDVYEEWFREQPSLALPDDSPFTIRPARPEDFETVYETVDAAFGKKRPRALYDWLYCRNPMGLARVWLQFERETGLLVKTGASFPKATRTNLFPTCGRRVPHRKTFAAWQVLLISEVNWSGLKQTLMGSEAKSTHQGTHGCRNDPDPAYITRHDCQDFAAGAGACQSAS